MHRLEINRDIMLKLKIGFIMVQQTEMHLKSHLKK